MPSYAPFYNPNDKAFLRMSVADLTSAYASDPMRSCAVSTDHDAEYSTAGTYWWLVTLGSGESQHLRCSTGAKPLIPSRYLTAATIFRGAVSSREAEVCVIEMIAPSVSDVPISIPLENFNGRTPLNS